MSRKNHEHRPQQVAAPFVTAAPAEPEPATEPPVAEDPPVRAPAASVEEYLDRFELASPVTWQDLTGLADRVRKFAVGAGIDGAMVEVNAHPDVETATHVECTVTLRGKMRPLIARTYTLGK